MDQHISLSPQRAQEGMGHVDIPCAVTILTNSRHSTSLQRQGLLFLEFFMVYDSQQTRARMPSPAIHLFEKRSMGTQPYSCLYTFWLP